MMKTQFSRRAVLRTGFLGGVGVLAAACAPATRLPEATAVVAPQPSANRDAPVAPKLDPTAPVATAAPVAQPSNVQPTNAPVTQTPPDSAATIAATPTSAVSAGSMLNAGITAAARSFAGSLSDQQRASANFAFSDAERLRWHWTNTRNFPRNGLSLNDLNASQREAAMALLRASVSESGFNKSIDIMNLQTEISGDPANYFVSLFGAPGDATWGWRFEGHHVSRHFTLQGDKITITPFFHGVWPTVSAAGKRIMNREEWAARELVRSLSPELRNTVVFQDQALTQHVTWNENYVRALEPVGAPLAALNNDQRALVQEIIDTWMGTQAEPVAREHLARVAAAGPEAIRFGWAGSQDERRPHYYRIQGPTFLLEHDNTRNGATHIHSVWRVFDQDFGQGLI